MGRGRAAFVDLVEADGEAVTHKVFAGDPASRLVLLVTDGAPNPYGWSSDAVASALLRRRLLAPLVDWWFGSALRVPRALGWGWNPLHRAFELRGEYVRGRPVPLRSPLGDAGPDPLAALRFSILRPLQRRLRAAGLEGLAWQAGFGNPVALGNFLLEEPSAGARGWAWVDLESGVPALFSPSPWAQLTFYLPRALRLHRPLFDDVDVARLRRYLERRAEALDAHRGEGTTARLLSLADALGVRQARWKGRRRVERGLIAAVLEGWITLDDARRYRHRPLRWGVALARHEARAVLARAGTRVRSWIRSLRGVRPLAILRTLGRYLVSQRYRTELARRYVTGRIDAWEARRAIDAAGASRLRAELDRDETSEYVTDFGVHLLVKPFVKAFQYVGVPLLFVVGAAGPALAAALLFWGGAIVRTIYTLGRLAQAALARQRKPWTALLVGTLPVVGNAAYPAELVASSVGEAHVLARFLLYDTFAALGRAVPIWGGPDSLTEHLANRLPDRWLRGRSPRACPGTPRRAGA